MWAALVCQHATDERAREIADQLNAVVVQATYSSGQVLRERRTVVYGDGTTASVLPRGQVLDDAVGPAQDGYGRRRTDGVGDVAGVPVIVPADEGVDLNNANARGGAHIRRRADASGPQSGPDWYPDLPRPARPSGSAASSAAMLTAAFRHDR